MTEYVAKRDVSRAPTHPGVVLAEAIEALNLPKVEIANRLGISRQHLYDILLLRKPVSPEVAVRIGKLMGNGPGVWVRMQAAYDLWHAEQSVDVSGIETLKPGKAA